MWKFTVIVILVVISTAPHVMAVCNQCKNGFACVSETEFQLCFGDQPDESNTYSCPGENEICSQYGRICMPNDTNVVPACRGKQNCVCDDVLDFLFVCTSRTTFTMCFNGNYTQTRGTCPGSQLCDVQKGANGEVPCTNKCIDDVADASICDFDYPVDLPTTPTVTPTTVTPSTITPSTVTPSTVTPSTVTPSTVTPSTVTPSTVTPSTVTPSTVTPSTITPPTTVIITPTPPNTANEVCRNQTIAGRFPYPNDTVCTNYVFCYWDTTELRGRDTQCPANKKYFNRQTTKCQGTQPSWCI